MATEHQSIELISNVVLEQAAVPAVQNATLRHVAYTVLEELLAESARVPAREMTLTLTLRRDDEAQYAVFTATGQIQDTDA